MKKVPGISHFREFIREQSATFDTESPSYKWWLLANVMIGTFMAVLDATIVNVGLPKIMASFGVGLDKIEWVLTAYMLALAVMLPTSGWLADRFGYKRVYFLGLFLFTLGSFLCGISPNEDILIFSRIIQGLGAGCLMPVGMAIITREFPPEKRGVALGFWSIASAASVSFGPLIGGYLVDRFSWPLIFDVNVPIGIAGMLATAIIQKEYRSKHVGPFDPIGFFSVTIFLPFLLYALTEGSTSTNSAGWSSPVVLTCFAVAAIAFVVFISAELIVDHPLIDLRLLKDYNFAIANVVTFIFGIGMFGSTFLLPLFLQNSLGYTALQAGAVFLPVGFIQGVVAPMAGISSNRINPKILIFSGAILLAFTFYLNSEMSYLTEHGFIMTTLYLRGVAMGIMFAPLTAAAVVDIPRHKMGQASGLLNVIRQVGGSFGVAILTTILTTRITYHTQSFGEVMQANSPAFNSVLRNIGYFVHNSVGGAGALVDKQSQAILMSHVARQSFVQAIDDDFLLAAFITLISAFPVLFLKIGRKGKGKQGGGPSEQKPVGGPEESAEPSTIISD
ncbi:MAG: DHA2 family efflux MFS transporter permease subunit [Bacteroidetes bacterium]|nr:DHA2 family efflux MFS transporter permease subunit [Bacteroidota bacterium]